MTSEGANVKMEARRTLDDGTVLRPMSDDRDELEACVLLQKTIWGEGFADVASPQVVKVVQKMGGVAAGAFAPDGRMLGFVFGITGLQEGRVRHWSHMLAVLPEARGRDLGYQLKLYQRRRLLGLGVETVEWTYDPLVAKNAYLNLVRLGARAACYHRDYYGSGEDSALSTGLGTDRFEVEWRLRDPAVRSAIGAPGAEGRRELAPALVRDRPIATYDPERADEPPEFPDAPRIRVEVPDDVQAVRRRSPEAARAWRATTREAFETAFERGYAVTGFHRDVTEQPPRCFYLLDLPERASESPR